MLFNYKGHRIFAFSDTVDNPANSEESFTVQDVFNLIKDV